ncbi:MAG: RlpA-like double-psi beta-barrel domain-containing protein [Solirubrobacteraceae bacterium]
MVLGCGSKAQSGAAGARTSTTPVPTVQAHPQAVEPVAGQGARAAAPTPSGHPAPAKLRPDRAPTGPASAGSGPARGAPTDAQVRAEVAHFQLAIAQYHLDRLNLSGALIDPSTLPPGQYFVSIASVFTDYGLPIACGGVLHVPQLGVANKTLPCGTEVTFVYGGRAIRVPVIDRGPYIAGREWDLTGASAEALRFPGLGAIQWRLG